MEIALLEDFLALSTARVFAKAAEVRNISQSAFTRRIKNLEFWVGTPLVDRSVHPVKLTEAGESFRSTAYEIIRVMEEARQEAKGISRKKDEVLEFHALHSLAISFFPQWLVRLEEKIGSIRSKVTAEDLSGCIEALVSGSSDFVLSFHHPAVPSLMESKPHPQITIQTDNLIAVSAVDTSGQARHSFATAHPIPLLRHPADSFLGRTTQMILEREECAFGVDFRYENSIAEALKAACLQGLGVCWMPHLAVLEELEQSRLIKISGPEQEARIAIRLHRTFDRGRPAVERFWSLCTSMADDVSLGTV